MVADGATLSTVSLAEVATVLTRHLRNPDKVLDSVRAQVAVEPFTAADALAVAALHPRVSAKGLSLGDRACLDLAQRPDARAVTAGPGLSLGIAIQLIRPPRS